jgi:hypothetical protein
VRDQGVGDAQERGRALLRSESLQLARGAARALREVARARRRGCGSGGVGHGLTRKKRFRNGERRERLELAKVVLLLPLSFARAPSDANAVADRSAGGVNERTVLRVIELRGV